MEALHDYNERVAFQLLGKRFKAADPNWSVWTQTGVGAAPFLMLFVPFGWSEFCFDLRPSDRWQTPSTPRVFWGEPRKVQVRRARLAPGRAVRAAEGHVLQDL